MLQGQDHLLCLNKSGMHMSLGSGTSCMLSELLRAETNPFLRLNSEVDMLASCLSDDITKSSVVLWVFVDERDFVDRMFIELLLKMEKMTKMSATHSFPMNTFICNDGLNSAGMTK